MTISRGIFMSLLSLLALSALASAMLEAIPVPGDTVTCAGRCGEVSGPPCSCDDKCLLYRNCCENMTLDCPDIWGQGQARFGQWLRSKVTCAKSGYYVITSCPQNETEFETNQEMEKVLSTPASLEPQSTAASENATGSENTDVTTRSIENDDSSGSQKVGPKTVSVTEALENAPVTDTAMAVTYYSPDILACHDGNLATAVKWDGVFELKDRQAPSSGQAEKMVLDYYTPSKGLTSTQVGQRCHANAIDYCPAGTDPQLASLCKSFTSYVVQLSKAKVFKNRFCYFCTNNNQNDMKPYAIAVRDQRSYSFSVVASISGAVLTFSALSEATLEAVGWRETTCSLRDSQLQEEKEEVEEEECHVNTCSAAYELRPNGKCRRLNHATISLPVDEFPFTSHQLDCLPEFMKCVFINTLGLEETTTDRSPQVYLDTKFQRLMHVVQLNTYLDFYDNIPIDIYFKVNNILHLSAAAKVLKRHLRKCPESGQSNKENKENSDSHTSNDLETSCKSKAAVSVKSSTNISGYPELKIYDLIYQKKPIFEDRGEVQDNTTTTFCMFSLPPEKIMADRRFVYCFEDALYKSDKDIMDSFAQLPCLAVLDGCQKSGVGRMTSRVGLTVTVTLIMTAKMLLSVLQMTWYP